MKNRLQGIKQQDTQAVVDTPSVDFSKITIGTKKVEDATFQYGDFYQIDKNIADRKRVLEAIERGNLGDMRTISDFFYKSSGIYNRLCRYMAYMYRYDWFVTPYNNSDASNPTKILNGFNKVLTYLDNFGVKKFFGEVALKVIRNGCYYGYVIRGGNRPSVQELPPKYCRSRFVGAEGQPLVEFNMRFFDEMFKGTVEKDKMLNLFPKEFKKGYELYKQNKLPPQF